MCAWFLQSGTKISPLLCKNLFQSLSASLILLSLKKAQNCMYISLLLLEWIQRNCVVNLSEEKIKDPTERHRLYKQQSAQRFSDFYIVITVKRTLILKGRCGHRVVLGKQRSDQKCKPRVQGFDTSQLSLKCKSVAVGLCINSAPRSRPAPMTHVALQ